MARTRVKPLPSNGEADGEKIDLGLPEQVAEVEAGAKKPARKTAADAMPKTDIVIPKLEAGAIELEIIGVTPLVVSCWSEKARRQMLDKQMKKARAAKEAKNPEADYLASRYIEASGEWDGVPATGLKGCFVNACRAVDGLPMTVAKRVIFVAAQGRTAAGLELVRIHGDHEMHEAMVRIDGGSTADIRHRAMYRNWRMRFVVQFLRNLISADQVAHLVELAGFIEGLCEHRPGSPKSNTGDWGRFRLARESEEVLRG